MAAHRATWPAAALSLLSAASFVSSSAASAASPFARFRFSWATPPVQAFPGAASRMMTAAEVDGFTRNFSSMMIWGLNTTCLDPRDNATTFPAFCADSWCQCFADRGHPLEQQRFVADMDRALQAQGAALKAAAAALGLAPRPTLGYIDFTSPRESGGAPLLAAVGTTTVGATTVAAARRQAGGRAGGPGRASRC